MRTISTPMHRKKSDFERLDCNYISQSVSYDFFSEWICWTLFECIHNPQILVDYIHTARLLMLLYEKNCIFILTHTNHTHTLYATNFRRKESWFITYLLLIAGQGREKIYCWTVRESVDKTLKWNLPSISGLYHCSGVNI